MNEKVVCDRKWLFSVQVVYIALFPRIISPVLWRLVTGDAGLENRAICSVSFKIGRWLNVYLADISTTNRSQKKHTYITKNWGCDFRLECIWMLSEALELFRVNFLFVGQVEINCESGGAQGKELPNELQTFPTPTSGTIPSSLAFSSC